MKGQPGNTAYLYALAWERGISGKEFRELYQHQYGKKHTKQLNPDQLSNLTQLLEALPIIEKGTRGNEMV